MGPGDELNGYRLTTPFTTTGGGHCQWAFASRGGEEYFVKQFLNPTYPLPDGPGSEKTKAAKRARCERFAKQHTEVAEKLRPLSATGGNLVVTRDFFRHAAHYYKVTVKVDAGTEGPPEIAALPVEERLTLLRVPLPTHRRDGTSFLVGDGLRRGQRPRHQILVRNDVVDQPKA